MPLSDNPVVKLVLAGRWIALLVAATLALLVAQARVAMVTQLEARTEIVEATIDWPQGVTVVLPGRLPPTLDTANRPSADLRTALGCTDLNWVDQEGLPRWQRQARGRIVLPRGALVTISRLGSGPISIHSSCESEDRDCQAAALILAELSDLDTALLRDPDFAQPESDSAPNEELITFAELPGRISRLEARVDLAACVGESTSSPAWTLQLIGQIQLGRPDADSSSAYIPLLQDGHIRLLASSADGDEEVEIKKLDLATGDTLLLAAEQRGKSQARLTVRVDETPGLLALARVAGMPSSLRRMGSDRSLELSPRVLDRWKKDPWVLGFISVLTGFASVLLLVGSLPRRTPRRPRKRKSGGKKKTGGKRKENA